MTGSIRLHVAAALAEGASIVAAPAPGALSGHRHAPRPGRHCSAVQWPDGEFGARIETVRRHAASLAVRAPDANPAAEPDLWLVFALLKRDATDLVVQKATELGVAALLPSSPNAATASDQRRSSDRHRHRGRRAVRAPDRAGASPAAGARIVLSDLAAERRLFAAFERGAAPRIGASARPTRLLVGPEGGFSPAELDALRPHPFVTPVSLGPRVLRAETACIAGLALLQGVDCR